MKSFPVLPITRFAAPDAPSVVGDDPYDAALAALLAQATHPPGPLTKLWRMLRSVMKRLHARRRKDGSSLPLEYWFISP